MKDVTSINKGWPLLASVCQAGGVVHDVYWDGRKASGKSVTTRSYRYRISATDLSDVKLTPVEGTIAAN